MTYHSEYKVAVASVDGKRISEHFGCAPLFVVYTVRKGKIVHEELRVNCKECERSTEDTQAGCWELMQELLPDVRVVICRGMGENAYVGLLRRDALPITTDEKEVEKAVMSYLRDRLKDDPHRVHRPRFDKQYENDA